VVVRFLGVLDLLDRGLWFQPGNLNQRWTFVTVIVHQSSQKSL
jgi:hypothetical protein